MLLICWLVVYGRPSKLNFIKQRRPAPLPALAASATGGVKGQGVWLPRPVKQAKGMVPAFRFLTCANGSIATQPGNATGDPRVWPFPYISGPLNVANIDPIDPNISGPATIYPIIHSPFQCMVPTITLKQLIGKPQNPRRIRSTESRVGPKRGTTHLILGGMGLGMAADGFDPNGEWVFWKFWNKHIIYIYIYTGWWLSHPSEKYEFVSRDDDIPN